MLISHFATDPHSLSKARAEFLAQVPSEGQWSKRESLQKFVTYDCLQKLEYINTVIMECLRFNPPSQNTTEQWYSKDVKLGHLEIKARDAVAVSINALHFNKNEWQRPYEFLPERFDPNSELYLTPGGKKRNPFSWVPFAGGKRICFGKTFAEMNLKVVAVYLS